MVEKRPKHDGYFWRKSFSSSASVHFKDYRSGFMSWAHREEPAALTILAVVGDLHLALLRAQQRLGHLGHRVPAGELAVQEVASARLLHDVRPGEARHLAEGVITVDNSAVLRPSIGYDEFLICEGGKRREKRGWKTVNLFMDISLNTLKQWTH